MSAPRDPIALCPDRCGHDLDYLATDEAHRIWFAHTGCCGWCGLAGDYCTCTPDDPCECADLHPMGSGLLTPAKRHEAGLPSPPLPGQGALLGGGMPGARGHHAAS